MARANNLEQALFNLVKTDGAKRTVFIECWVQPESVVGEVSAMARFGQVQLHRIDSPELGIIRPVDVEGAMGGHMLRCEYRQVNPLYQQWDAHISPLLARWMAMPIEQHEELLERAEFHDNLPVPIDLSKFPEALWPNPDFPATTAIGELQFPVKVINGAGDGGLQICGGLQN